MEGMAIDRRLSAVGFEQRRAAKSASDACGAALAIALVALASPCCEARAHEASCRVTNGQSGVESAGSGTLVDVTDDRQAGLVLTCAHLFSEGVGQVVVAFPAGARHGGNVIAVDREADLAAVEIAAPRAAAAIIATSEEIELRRVRTFRACGFGGDGRLHCTTGRFVGTAGDATRVSWRFSGAVRSGDSGGGVFDDSGRLVAVVWGAADGVTYASGGAPLKRFLDRVLGRRAERVLARRPIVVLPGASCPNGMCPLVPQGGLSRDSDEPSSAPAGRGPAAGSDVKPGRAEGESRGCACDEEVTALDQRVRSLEHDVKEFARLEHLEAYARVDDVTRLADEDRAERASLAERIAGLAASGKAGRALGTAAAGALGVSGPVGWGIVAAGTAAGALVGRRLRKRAKRRSGPDRPSEQTTSESTRTRPTEATAAAASTFLADATPLDEQTETVHPVERDDREARQLLRLSQLEGRDPLQDAVAGRLALDRLDALADGDDDAPQRAWADELRRELRERFNEIAPTKWAPEWGNLSADSPPQQTTLTTQRHSNSLRSP